MINDQDIRNKLKEFRVTSQEVNLFDPNINDKSTQLYKFKDTEENKYKIWIFTNRIKIETPLATSLLFSINFPDKICLANKVLEDLSGIGKLFTDNSKDDQIRSCIKLLKDDLKSLNFDNYEGLTVYQNSLQLTLSKERQILPEIDACKKIKSKIELNFPDKDYEIGYSDLPSDLKQILLEFETLSISNDFERGEKIQEMSKEQRSDLIKKVEPKLKEIHFFLDTFGDKPFSDGAIRLQSLTELVVELILDIEKKNQS